MTNLKSILKSRHITLLTKVRLVKAMVFPVVMYATKSWTIEKVECQRTDAFELWCWRRFLRVLWTARRSNQWILKEISPEYSLEGFCYNWSSNTLATWCKELTHWKIPWCWERLKARGEGNRGWDGYMPSLIRQFEQAPRVGDGQGSLVCCSLWGHKDSDMIEWLNWTVKWSINEWFQFAFP